MRDDVILARALTAYASRLRADAKSRKYAGEPWASHRETWRATANRAVELATQAASMAEVFEEPHVVACRRHGLLRCPRCAP